MTKVIKGEFEKLKDLKDKDASLTFDTSLDVFNDEFNRMSKMDNDLFRYEVEVTNIPCNSNMDDDSEQRMSHEVDDDTGYDPSDVSFNECWREDGYCNGGNLPGAYYIGNSLHYQNLEWYEALEDIDLKEQALRNKAIMEGSISDDESSNDCWRRWRSHEIVTTITMKLNMRLKLMTKDMSYVKLTNCRSVNTLRNHAHDTAYSTD
nr:hypothetical protein [Tanacetum cinerariifolium]